MVTFFDEDNEESLTDEGEKRSDNLPTDAGNDDSLISCSNPSTKTEEPSLQEYAAVFHSDKSNDSTVKREHRIAFEKKCYGGPTDHGMHAIETAASKTKVFHQTKYQQYLVIFWRIGPLDQRKKTYSLGELNLKGMLPILLSPTSL